MKKLEDLFEHQIKDLYSAETQLIDALPKMAKAANDKKLKKLSRIIWRKQKSKKNALKRFVMN